MNSRHRREAIARSKPRAENQGRDRCPGFRLYERRRTEAYDDNVFPYSERVEREDEAQVPIDTT